MLIIYGYLGLFLLSFFSGLSQTHKDSVLFKALLTEAGIGSDI